MQILQPHLLQQSMRRLNDPRPWLVLGLVAGALFAIDLIADPKISVIALYGALIVAALRNFGPRAVVALGVLSGALIIASHLLDNAPDREASVVDAIFGLTAIGATTLLTLRIDQANRRARDAQAGLAHVSRLLLADELSTAVAHELNQPLAAAAANAQAAQRWLAAAPPNRAEANDALQRTIEAIAFAGTLVHRRRDRGRRTVHHRVDLRAIVAEACALVEPRIIAQSIDLRLDLSSDLEVRGDRIQLQQVLVNLMVNAIEAMSDVARPATLTVLGCREGDWTVLRVLDVGCGLDPAILEHLFEPFRTSKPDGLGMGLAITRSIVESHGGRIQAEARRPHGTIFTLRFPRFPPDASPS